MRTLLLAAVFVSLGFAQTRDAGETRPLPEPGPFFDAVRENLAKSQRQQNGYAYRERRTDLHTNPFGRMGTGGTRVFEVVPAPDGQSLTRRLVQRDDRPVADADEERINITPRRPGSPARGVDDVVRVLEFSIARRERIGGRPFVVVDFTPRPDVKPATRQGRMARAFKGSLWVDEGAMEVARVEATAVDDISYGFGLVARVRKGATASARREPVEGGIWLPTSLRFQGEGRAVLFRRLDLDYALEWFDYRLVVGGR